MDNNFDKWNRFQQKLEQKSGVVFCDIREIWWCSIGHNIGSEEYGKNASFERPALIMKVYKNRTALIAPLTSKNKEGEYYFSIQVGSISSCAILSQVRTVSTKRFSRKIGKISQEDFRLLMAQYISSL